MKEPPTSPEFDAFKALLDRSQAVASTKRFSEREAEYKRRSALNPHRRGPKPKRKRAGRVPACVLVAGRRFFLFPAANEGFIGQASISKLGKYEFESSVVINIPAVVVAECLFIQIAKQVEWFDTDVSAVQPTLQQRPEVLHCVGVDVSRTYSTAWLTTSCLNSGASPSYASNSSLKIAAPASTLSRMFF